MKLRLLLVVALGLAGCAQEGRPAPKPALWEVSDGHGATGWLFGTIHALPDQTHWRTPLLQSAVDQAGVLVVEVANLGDARAGPKAFAAVSDSVGLPPLLNRVPAEDRRALGAALERAGLDEAMLRSKESWAAALLIANATRERDSDNGVDRALLASGKPVLALEGFTEQFAIFDRLPQADQAVLLSEAAQDIAAREEREQVDAWLRGDLAVLERELESGLLADPELRQALLVGRNKAWAERIAGLLATGRRPLVAVGAGHMVGAQGLPALLAARGFEVRRVQ